MKITVKALLINISEEHKRTIDSLMTIFCSAIRFSFKRLLKNMKIGDLEKLIADKYGLNIRQAKDAVENARQTIVSQKELVKMNYDNYSKKVKTIEKQLEKDNLSEEKKKALISKLDKRKRKQQYWKNFIDTNTIPSVIFGTKDLFLRRCKGLISKEEWQEARSNRIYSRGDKTKKGNPNLRLILINGETFLEISTLTKSQSGRYEKIQVPIYLPRKVSKKTGCIKGRDYKSMILNYLNTGEAYQVEIIRHKGNYYCHITIDELKINDYILKYTSYNGLIGIDTNPDGFALTTIDREGNYKCHSYLPQHELLYARSNRRLNLCGELVKHVVEIAKQNQCGIAIEDLKFSDDKDVTSKFARVKHQFIYKTLLQMLEVACIREGIEVVKVKPQFTSKIGLYKYCNQYGMVVHNGASMVIARRAYGFKERIPKLLKDKLIPYQDSFNKKNEWAKWSIINNILKKKGSEKPYFWLMNRKKLLGIA